MVCLLVAPALVNSQGEQTQGTQADRRPLHCSYVSIAGLGSSCGGRYLALTRGLWEFHAIWD